MGSPSEDHRNILVAAIPALVDYIQVSYPKQILAVASRADYLFDKQASIIKKLHSQMPTRCCAQFSRSRSPG